MIHIEPATEETLSEVQHWFEDEATRRWLGGTEWPREAMRLSDPSHGRFALVTLLDDRPVALIDLERYEDRSASFAIVVDPAHRGKGLAALAIDELTNYAKNLDVIQLLGYVESGNTISERLLRGRGFAAIGVDPDGFAEYALKL